MRSLRIIAVVGLALASSISSITNGFAYDDIHIISSNPVVHTLDGWWNLFRQSYWLGGGIGALYRPLTILSYALQWAAGKGNPLLFHAVNIGLYAAVCVTFYWVLTQLLPRQHWVAWSCAALFAVHPVHVEAVGNIVGQAELSCALVVMLAVGLYVKWRRQNALTPLRIAMLLLLYLVACLLKEHGILLPGLLLAVELVMLGEGGRWRDRLIQLRPFYLSLIAVGAAFVWLRFMVLGDLVGDIPHLVWIGVPWSARFWTMCIVVQEWFRLFLWPARLSINYGPGNINIHYGPEPIMLATLVLILSVISLAILLRRKAPIVTLGVLWTAITLALVSNLLFPAGIILAERTLFLPSAGVIMMVVGSMAMLIQSVDARSRTRARVWASVLISVLLLLGTLQSSKRQKIWRNNKAMFMALFNDSPADYRGAWVFSGALLRAGRFEESLQMLEIATQFYGDDPGLLEELGFMYRLKGDCDKAIPVFRKVLRIQPSWTRPRGRLAMCLVRQGKLDEAWSEAVKGMENPSQPRNALLLVRIVLQKKKMAQLSAATSPPRK